MTPTVLIAVAAGIASALLYASMLVLGPVVGAVPWFVSPAPLVLAGLTLGRGAGFIACAAGLAAFVLVGMSLAAGLMYLVSDVLPALVILALATRPAPGVAQPDPSLVRHWYPPGEILARLALVPLVVLVVLALMAPGHVDGIEGLLRDAIGGEIDTVLSSVGGNGQPLMDDATRTAVVNNAAAVLPGAMAMSWLFRAALAGMLAQALAQRLGRALRPSPIYVAMELPGWFGALFAGLVTVAVLVGGDVGYVAGAMAMGLSLPFMLLGFKLVHIVARRTAYPVLVLGVFYFAFLSVSALAIVAMVLAGLVEYLANLRRRAAGRASEEE